MSNPDDTELLHGFKAKPITIKPGGRYAPRMRGIQYAAASRLITGGSKIPNYPPSRVVTALLLERPRGSRGSDDDVVVECGPPGPPPGYIPPGVIVESIGIGMGGFGGGYGGGYGGGMRGGGGYGGRR
jgi:hypothetical protein